MNEDMFEDIFWHDGNVIGFQFSTMPQTACLKVRLMLYPDIRSSTREMFELAVINPKRVLLSADIMDLIDNYGAGHISDGVILKRDGSSIVKIELTLGYIEIHCDGVSIISVS